MNNNPWFWAPHTNRQSFEQELQKTAVHLRDKNVRVTVPKVSIEDVKARKNALAAKGMNIAAINKTTTTATGGIAEPRKIK